MVALRVVLGDDLPVGVDLVLDSPRSTQILHREAGHLSGQVRQMVAERSPGGLERREDEALPDLQRDR